MNKTNIKHEPLFHVTKKVNCSFKQKLIIRAISIFVALLVSSLLLIIFYGYSPIEFISSLIKGVIGTERRMWNFLHDLAILLGISLSVVLAFKMKFWNLGADGQTIIGGLACVACMYYLGGKVNDALLILISLICSIVFASLWAVIPAIFKSKWQTNETLFTLMMNYIAFQLVCFFIDSWVKTGSGVLSPIKYGNLPKLCNNKFLLNIIVVFIMTIIVNIYLKYSKQGFELSLVGECEATARYAGINVKKVIIRTMAISGAICGVMGFLLVAGYNHTISTELTAGRGFTAIIVVWLAKFNPLYMILTAFLFVFLSRGTGQLITDLHITSSAFKDIIISIFYFSIIALEFFINYKIVINKNKLSLLFKKKNNNEIIEKQDNSQRKEGE